MWLLRGYHQLNRTGSPRQNPFVESFGSRFRDAVVVRRGLDALLEARPPSNQPGSLHPSGVEWSATKAAYSPPNYRLRMLLHTAAINQDQLAP